MSSTRVCDILSWSLSGCTEVSPESPPGLGDLLPRWLTHMVAGWCCLLVADLSSSPCVPFLGTDSMSLWHRGHLPRQAIHKTTAENAILSVIWPRRSHTLTSTCSTTPRSQQGRGRGKEGWRGGRAHWGHHGGHSPHCGHSLLFKKQAFELRKYPCNLTFSRISSILKTFSQK